MFLPQVANAKQPPARPQQDLEGDLSPNVRIVARLSSADIIDVAEDRIMAVLVRESYDRAVAELIAHRIANVNVEKLGTYQEAGIKFYGNPFFDSNNDADERERYFKTALQINADIRDLFSPYACPSDTLRSVLDEIWPSGANLLTLDGRKMCSAICRIFDHGGEALPHQDNLSWDAPSSPDAQQFKRVLTALTYLKMSGQGGEVELWNELLGIGDYNDRRLKNTYGLRRDAIGMPELVLKPSPGDMLIFNASKIHAVRAVQSGYRATISSFIGFVGRRQSLKVWQ